MITMVLHLVNTKVMSGILICHRQQMPEQAAGEVELLLGMKGDIDKFNYKLSNDQMLRI